jgi:hypothetical protein
MFNTKLRIPQTLQKLYKSRIGSTCGTEKIYEFQNSRELSARKTVNPV